jgi:O-antigen ligase
MRAINLSSYNSAVNPVEQSIAPHPARVILLGMVAFLYSGGAGFLTLFSSYLFSGFYLAIFVCAFLCLFSKNRRAYDFKPIMPYLIWIVCYCLWGIIWLADKDSATIEVMRVITRHALFLGAIAIVLRNRQDLLKLARLIQIAVIINCIVSIEGFLDPGFTARLAYQFPSVVLIDELRPSGLWINPNVAAYSFLLGFLMSYWTRGVLAWSGRIAAISGIILSASRTGIYVLLICLALHLLFKIKSIRLSSLHTFIIINMLVLIVCLCWIVLYNPGIFAFDVTGMVNIDRITDFSEDKYGGQSRIYIASLATQYAINGPWHGYGIFTFQKTTDVPYETFISQGAHNIYLAVFGETGVLGIFSYLALLSIGIVHMLKARMAKSDRFIVFLMWISYLIIGFAWHDQFTATGGIIHAGLLYQIPGILKAAAVSQVEPEGQ